MLFAKDLIYVELTSEMLYSYLFWR